MHLVVLGDSFAFTDDRGPRWPSDPVLYPNVAARRLAAETGEEVETTVLARPGTGVRDAWRTLTKDRHTMFDVLPRADAVIVSYGSFDHVPIGVPAPVDALVPFLRPARLRRRVRATLKAVYPRLVTATGGRFALTPSGEFGRLFDATLLQVRALTHAAPGVVMLPAGHRAAHYAYRHRHRIAREQLTAEIAARHGFPTVASWPAIERHLDELNADGIHWPAAVHAEVGEAFAQRLLDQLEGRLATPPSVWAS